VKRYDRAYFDKWYRDPRHRVISDAAVARKARMVLGVAEYLLGRPVRTVLDVGCGEGAWLAPLRRLRPGVAYLGVDPSEYAVRRFGAARNLRLGTLAALDAVAGPGPFDVVVCCDVLQYVSDDELRAGLGHVRALLGGVAFLEAYTTADDVEGDLRGWHPRTPDAYRRLFRQAGLTPCGLHCYAAPSVAENTAALERAEGGDRPATVIPISRART
jgi:SAM-dependent methyltransferase